MDDRTRKASKISAILQDFCDGKLSTFSCLDLGCGRGVISAYLARSFKVVIGIDLDLVAIRDAENQKPKKSESPYYLFGSGYTLPFTDDMFDVVICAQVYEHMTDHQEMVNEIARVLRPGGFCFFSGPNRLAIMEEHYWLPFLSWLPHKIASLYMKMMKRGNVYDIYPLTYWQLNRIWRNFKIIDYSLKLLREPHDYSVEERVEKFNFIKLLPNWLLKSLCPYYPNYNWIVIKPL